MDTIGKGTSNVKHCFSNRNLFILVHPSRDRSTNCTTNEILKIHSLLKGLFEIIKNSNKSVSPFFLPRREKIDKNRESIVSPRSISPGKRKEKRGSIKISGNEISTKREENSNPIGEFSPRNPCTRCPTSTVAIYFECVLTNSHADVPSCKSLSYPVTSAKEEAACTPPSLPCSLKLLVLQDFVPPRSGYSQRVAAVAVASRFVNISWGWRSRKTDLTAHIKERGQNPPLSSSPPSFLGFRTEIREKWGGV